MKKELGRMGRKQVQIAYSTIEKEMAPKNRAFVTLIDTSVTTNRCKLNFR
jgi:hypothetical protein